MIAPFVNSVDAITELRGILGEKGKKIAIVAQIQTIEGFNNFDNILTVSYIAKKIIYVEEPFFWAKDMK